MEKVKKTKRLNVTWCVLVMCLFLNALIISFLIVNGLDHEWHCIKNIILVIVFVLNCVSVIMLAKHDNERIQSEKDECMIKMEQVTNEYKAFVSNELKNLSNASSTYNYRLSKTLEMIIETFNERDCDDSKLKTLKTVIEAVLNSHETDKKTISKS